MSQSSYSSSQIQSVQTNQQVSSCPKLWHDTCYPITIEQSIIFSTIMSNGKIKVHISIARKKTKRKQSKQGKSPGDP